MALSLLGSTDREVNGITLFEIRLDQDHLILRGGNSEAASTLLKGSVVLCLSRPLRIHSLRLQLTGKQSLFWCQTSGPGGIYIKNKKEILRSVWDFVESGSMKGENLPPGNYEWPFEYALPGNSPVSVEGLEDTWIIYRMKAKIERNVLHQNKVTRKHVRLIKAFDPSTFRFSSPMSVEHRWPGKLDYCFSIPSQAVIFGTALRLDFRLIPLVKGIKIVDIEARVLETHEFRFTSGSDLREHRAERTVVVEKWIFPDDAETEDIDGRDGYVFHRMMKFPTSLRKCLQTVHSMGIHTWHTLSFNLRFQNPDNHLSEVHASFPLTIYISPNLPLDANNNLVCGNPQQQVPEALSPTSPPLYGDHQFDQLYGDIDVSGYNTTPGGVSTLATPLLPRSHAASAENLASMDAVTSRDFAPNVLQSRLHGLENTSSRQGARDRPDNSGSAEDGSGPSTQGSAEEQNSPPAVRNSRPASGFFGNLVMRSSNRDRSDNPGSTEDGSGPSTQGPTEEQDSPPAVRNSRPTSGFFGNLVMRSSNRLTPSTPVSRRTSAENLVRSGFPTPQHIEFSAEDLSRVPSYSTALQTRPTAPINDGLPNYQPVASNSNPSSPSTGPAHMRNQSGESSSSVRQHENAEDAQRRRMMLTAQNPQ